MQMFEYIWKNSKKTRENGPDEQQIIRRDSPDE